MRNSDTAIHIENISKYYRIGVKSKMHDSLMVTFLDIIKKPLSNYHKYRSLYKFDEHDIIRSRDAENPPEDIIWALRDVSFDIKKGEALGIIGSNGAGKSTLLKVLSRITHPSTGFAEIHGNVSCLLEVGTGFHPELTGRENVFLNGTVLGMKKREIDSKFDEIVAFSGVEKFIDTPVKRYSSGMTVRLAFAVAAHLEPEILIIDEVLAVGDVQFQRKCLGKMDEVAKEGRTVLFVSHNMSAINQLCSRAVLLDNGQVTLDGTPDEVITSYLTKDTYEKSIWNCPEDHGQGDMKLRRVRILSLNGNTTNIINHDQEFNVEITYHVAKELSDAIIVCRISDTYGNIVFTSWDTDSTDLKHRVRAAGRYSSTCKVNRNMLKPGIYLLSVGAFNNKQRIYDFHEHIMSLEITPLGYTLNPERLGIISPLLDWEISQKYDTP